jgi:hypothetical protein
MNIEDINPQQYVDLFGGDDVQKQQGASFGSEIVDTDILSGKKDQSSLKEETQNQDPANSGNTEEKKEDTDEVKDVDLLGTTSAEQAKGTPGRKPKNDFSDISGYFEGVINVVIIGHKMRQTIFHLDSATF